MIEKPSDRVPPDVDKLLGLLHDHEIRFVVAGSYAAKIYGADLEPGDFDIVPETSCENLTRLAALLSELDARPTGPFGSWTELADGELKWIARETTAEEVAAWAPDPNDADTMDHLYPTRYGSFDVVPKILGTYEFLRARAIQIPVFGYSPWVAHIDDLLSRITVPRREKDIPRVRALREIQRALATSSG